MATVIQIINTHNDKEILLKKTGQKEYQMEIIYPDIISLKIMMNLNINSINFLIQKSKLMMKITKQTFVFNSINLKFIIRKVSKS